jgi:chemotaxis protein methyltransferase CheR
MIHHSGLTTPGPLSSGGGTAMTDREYALLGALLERETGIVFPPRKRRWLELRLSPRLRALGLTSFAAYHDRILADATGERLEAIDAACTLETQFFRDAHQFRFLEGRLLPDLIARAEHGARPRRVRIWSAGCATGEEPYSIAMALLATCPPGWQLDVLGTDICRHALAAARRGEWPIARAAEITPSYLHTFMLRGVGANSGTMKAGEALRRVVRFEVMNLNEPRYPPRGPFEAIFCRNVLIYFSQASRARVVDELLAELTPGGVLFLGEAEGLAGLATGARLLEPSLYVRERGAGGEDAR